MRHILGKKFYIRPAALVAKGLLGKRLVRQRNGKIKVYMITEVEAYTGPEDKASHAAGGKRTKRTEIMFGPGGYWYIYFTYGMHWLLNVVTGEKEYPSAVLIRAVRGISGPARLTKALGIDGKLNGGLVARKTGFWIEDSGYRPKNIVKGPRIGVDYAGSYWSKKKLRFWMANS